MRAKVKYVSVDVDLATYLPLDPRIFGIVFTLSVGIAGSDGGDYFDVTVCSPGWLAEQVDLHGGSIDGRHHLVVNHWDSTDIVRILTKAFEEPEGKDWKDLAIKLSRIGQWEFEDYQPFDPAHGELDVS